jgi:hypothetical protein
MRVASVRGSNGFPMCVKCAKLDKKIEHYETILVSIGDRVTVERLMAMVANLRAQKAALHPEAKQ